MEHVVNKLIKKTHTHTTTYTHTEYAILIAFPPQQWLQERAATLRHTYISCHVETRSS